MNAIPIILVSVFTAACMAAERRPHLLIDSIHAHNHFEPLTPENTSYHTAYGYRRAMAELRRHGVGVSEAKAGRIDAAKLAGVDVLFINLVSADRPPFFVGEIEAIGNFVRGGGGLMLIADHTNCYYHANRLAPLLEQFGVEVFHETACEPAGDALGQGVVGWIRVSRFAADHPVTRGVRWVGMQAAGALGPIESAVATTGPKSWGDAAFLPPFGENVQPGFYGNWKQDAAERAGPLGVVVAKELGKGRVVVVADQNVFADPFLFYGDNARLWTNAVAWLCRRELKPAEAIAGPAVLCYEDPARAAFGDMFGTGYYNAFALIGRAHHTVATDRFDPSGYELIVFAHNNYAPGEAEVEAVVAHLKGGRNVLLLTPDLDGRDKPRGVTAALAARLGPGATTLARKSTETAWKDVRGKLITYVARDGARNGAIPPPEKLPAGAATDSLTAVLKRSLVAGP